jgi:hypothetical protein
MAWGVHAGSVFASTYPGLTLKLGHSRFTISNGIQTSFDTNFAGVDPSPTTVFQGSYGVPSASNEAFWPWPEFQREFDYDGTHSVIFEIDAAPGGDADQLLRWTGFSPSPTRLIVAPFESEIGNYLVCRGNSCHSAHLQQEFVLATKRSFAVSTYYDLGGTAIDAAAPLVDFVESLGGPLADGVRSGGFSIAWDAASAGPTGEPDPTTATGFTSDFAAAVIGHRFVRFQITIDADPFTGAVPVIRAVNLAARTLAP